MRTLLIFLEHQGKSEPYLSSFFLNLTGRPNKKLGTFSRESLALPRFFLAESKAENKMLFHSAVIQRRIDHTKNVQTKFGGGDGGL